MNYLWVVDWVEKIHPKNLVNILYSCFLWTFQSYNPRNPIRSAGWFFGSMCYACLKLVMAIGTLAWQGGKDGDNFTTWVGFFLGIILDNYIYIRGLFLNKPWTFSDLYETTIRMTHGVRRKSRIFFVFVAHVFRKVSRKSWKQCLMPWMTIKMGDLVISRDRCFTPVIVEFYGGWKTGHLYRDYNKPWNKHPY